MALPALPSPADAVDRPDAAARGRAASRDARVSQASAVPSDRTAAGREDPIEEHPIAGGPPEEDSEVQPRLSGAAVVRA